MERLGRRRDLIFRAMWVVSNLFRASTAVRRHMEASVLPHDQLSWTLFTTLWVLWIWGTMEGRGLAAVVGITRPTTTGVVSFRMTDLVNCSAFADSLDLTATAGAGFGGFIFDAIQSAIDIGVARYDLNVLTRLRERN